MRRQSSNTESLVYAYGCGQPLSGWPQAEAEQERTNILWDRLVGIERDYLDAILAAAARDEPRIRALCGAIDAIREELRSAAKSGAAKNPARLDELRAARRELWAALAQWRKAHPDTLRALELVRRGRVVEARQQTDCWWPNYNAVIQRYEAQRIAVLRKGRRLNLHDIERDDGCLTVQIQRTRSGLGASPEELQSGEFAALQIGRVDPRAYQPTAGFRGARDRLCRTVVEMRIDAEGHALRLPVWMHRPLPPAARIKSAQIVWRRQGDRLRYQLCLTLSQPARTVVHPGRGSPATAVRIAIADLGNGLQVAVANEAARPERLILDAHWMAMMDRVERLAAILNDESAAPHERIRARLERPGLWARLLRRRREIYRLWARALCQRYARIEIHTPALSEQAWIDRARDVNALRHRACAHSLVAELQHQGRKHGCEITVAIAAPDASAPVPSRVRRQRIKDLPAPAARESTALASAEASA